MKELVTAIKAVGFPIVMCLILVYILVTVLDRNSTAIENNTIALTRICAIVERPDANVK